MAVGRRVLVAATTVVAFLLLAGSAAARTVTVTVSQANLGKAPRQSRHVTLHQGDVLRIAFKGNWYDSGYSWKRTLKPRRAVLRSIGSKTIPPRRCCGFPETIYYSYNAAGQGTTDLRYTLSGPGHPDAVALTVTARVSRG